MTTQLATRSVYEVTASILNLVASDLQASSTKAYLADLRQSVNRDVHRATGVFPIVFANIPDQYLGESGSLTVGERSIILALQLLAMHQHGNQHHVHAGYDEETQKLWVDLGASLRALRVGEDSQAVDRRFNAMITSASLSELANHLRHLIKLLKSRTNAKVDYAQLGQVLVWFQIGYQSSVRLIWWRSYYRRSEEQKGEESDER